MKKKIVIIFLLLIVSSFLFYWYEIRPGEIRSYCDWYAKWGFNESHGDATDESYQLHYDSCLHSKGLK